MTVEDYYIDGKSFPRHIDAADPYKGVFWITVFYVMIQQMKMEWRSEIRRKRH